MKLNRLNRSKSDPCFHLSLSALLAFFLLAQSHAATAAVPAGTLIGFDHIEESTIFFNVPPDAKTGGVKPQKPLKTSLFDLSYLGILKADEGDSYFLFSGRPCQNCLEDRGIFAIRPSSAKPTSFVYPGKIFEPKSRALVLESRAFFGKCLSRKGDVLVVFQKEKVDRCPRLQMSVIIAEASKNYLSERLLERKLPSLNATLKLVKNKSCHEIEGRNRLMLNKPLDLHPRSNITNDDEGDDEDKDKEDKDKNIESEKSGQTTPEK